MSDIIRNFVNFEGCTELTLKELTSIVEPSAKFLLEFEKPREIVGREDELKDPIERERVIQASRGGEGGFFYLVCDYAIKKDGRRRLLGGPRYDQADVAKLIAGD